MVSRTTARPTPRRAPSTAASSSDTYAPAGPGATAPPGPRAPRARCSAHGLLGWAGQRHPLADLRFQLLYVALLLARREAPGPERVAPLLVRHARHQP